ncbi:DUF1934 domain-containing protein [Macrococcus equipercicus]|uniref:DUF1934 domain-containing protein n=1 Tax=Macrococcus equipercicus TaxID=69967 RepID=A0A9Q9BQI8_9STAP|nr:DUF1934 domain-containing protein [Macrococcus equipercicus]KAA1039348.1 DUF1934 domain-containing protein [Macrococcus equipercicus]UTH13639.1 DUF1934 domain-containing protein [Macrococcus equipercicus]
MKVWVTTEQKLKQNNEVMKYHNEVEGTLTKRRVPYVSYTEMLDGEPIDVRVKMDPAGIRISRRGAVKMDFLFVYGETTQNVYTTPAGRTVMDVTTTRLDYKALSTGGRLIIHYKLSERGEDLGQFKYQLDYKESAI